MRGVLEARWYNHFKSILLFNLNMEYGSYVLVLSIYGRYICSCLLKEVSRTMSGMSAPPCTSLDTPTADSDLDVVGADWLRG